MLTKHTDIEIPADNPFANDKLERRKVVENLTRLVQSTNQPFVISIEAPWGWGKTTFIKMWKAHLESFGHICLYFNAWENDFVEDPLIAFIGEIKKTLVEKKAKGKANAQLRKLQSIGGKIVRRALPLTIQIATQGLLSQEIIKKASDTVFTSSDEIANFASELAEEKIKQYEIDKNGILEFKNELTKFAKSLSEEENRKPPLVFFIDELDRCRPDFSIALLERIKHVFNAEGIVFILSIDREQIEQSVKSIYGQNMEPDGYLRRFIDFKIHLSKPSTESFCTFLFQRFHISEIFDGRRNKVDEQDTLMRTFIKLARSYRFSLRVIEQCFTEVNLLIRTTPTNIKLYPHFVSFLVAFKAYQPETYALLRHNLTYDKVQDIIKLIEQDLDMADRTYRRLLLLIEAFLIYGYLEYQELQTALSKIKATADSNDYPSNQHSKDLLSIMEPIEYNEFSGIIKSLISRLDMVESLVAN